VALRTFLKLDINANTMVAGDVTVNGYENWIEIVSLEFAENRSGSPAIPGRVSMNDLVFRKNTDRSSPRLFYAGASGEVFSQATFVLVNDSTPVPTLIERWFLSTVLITNYVWTHAIGGSFPTDAATMAFDTIGYGFTPSGQAEIKYGWDLKGNKPA
jgi:type VI protein secretion system component Hcp